MMEGSRAGYRRDGGKDRRRSRARSGAADLSRRGARFAPRPRSAPRSDLSSGWSGSGPIISASRPTRSEACPAPMSARPSGPHVLGRFTDLLLAAEGHPAMLFYLDQTVSMGANSTAGINRTRGLNENLAREILELHTLGVRSGYTQDDVIGFANVLTGWTLVPPGRQSRAWRRIHRSIPVCTSPARRRCSEKSTTTKRWSRDAAVLRDLAAHPATATHVATKLARYFVADTPPPALVERMAKALRRYRRRSQARSPRRWSRPTKPGRSRPPSSSGPSEWVVGMVRATGITQADPARFTDGQALLGEPLWRPPSPKGFPDDEASWIDGMGRRLDVANNFAERVVGPDRSSGGHRDRARIVRCRPR